jgi:hypothetical protein
MAEEAVEFGEDGRRTEAEGRLDAAAFHRNHAPIWAVLAPLLAGKTGDVLEAGSGTGQHVAHFAAHSPGIVWWPSDLNEAHLKASRPGARMRTCRISVRRCGSISPIPAGMRGATGCQSCWRCSAPT